MAVQPRAAYALSAAQDFTVSARLRRNRLQETRPLDVRYFTTYNLIHKISPNWEEFFMSIGGQSDAKTEQKVYRLTPEGFAKKKERLDYLRTVKRKEIADYIHEAKEAGDITESSAYEDAKNEQAKVEGEILQLERLLEAAEIMTADMHDTLEGPPVVRIGMQVDVETD